MIEFGHVDGSINESDIEGSSQNTNQKWAITFTGPFIIEWKARQQIISHEMLACNITDNCDILCARRLVPRSWVRFPMWLKLFSVTFIFKNNTKTSRSLIHGHCLMTVIYN